MTDNNKGTKLLHYGILNSHCYTFTQHWGLYHKTLYNHNEFLKKASVFVKASQKYLTITKAPGYYTTEFLTAVLILNTGGPYHKTFYNHN
jgi:hypothetical protein